MGCTTASQDNCHTMDGAKGFCRSPEECEMKEMICGKLRRCSHEHADELKIVRMCEVHLPTYTVQTHSF